MCRTGKVLIFNIMNTSEQILKNWNHLCLVKSGMLQRSTCVCDQIIVHASHTHFTPTLTCVTGLQAFDDNLKTVQFFSFPCYISLNYTRNVLMITRRNQPPRWRSMSDRHTAASLNVTVCDPPIRTQRRDSTHQSERWEFACQITGCGKAL